MMRLDYIAGNCTDCGACEEHYPGLRQVAELYRGSYFSPGEWSNIAGAITAAVRACKVDALRLLPRN
jgi:ferredoxin